MSEHSSEDLAEALPHGDILKPTRPAENPAEPLTDELQDRLDEIGDQNLAEAGAGPEGWTPRAPTDAENTKPRPPGAAFPGEDEGPLGSGGQLRGPDAGSGSSS